VIRDSCPTKVTLNNKKSPKPIKIIFKNKKSPKPIKIKTVKINKTSQKTQNDIFNIFLSHLFLFKNIIF